MLSIYTWDGQDFQSVARIPWGDQTIDILLMDSVHEITIQDIDHNGTIEVSMSGGIASKNDIYAIGLPWREATNTLAWNGSYFVLSYIDYTPPEYRFQALQDADREMGYGIFDKAQSHYQDVIFNENLDWWSKERKEYERYNSIHSFLELISRGMSENPTPYPTLPALTLDPSEYPRLAAYAYYRIMLLHLVQGGEAEAASTYQTLQETFGADPYAAPYVEMASAFWEAYQSTHKMYDGCAAAIQYAVEHPEILTPLGSDYHGWQSHVYVPADVCPFR